MPVESMVCRSERDESLENREKQGVNVEEDIEPLEERCVGTDKHPGIDSMRRTDGK